MSSNSFQNTSAVIISVNKSAAVVSCLRPVLRRYNQELKQGFLNTFYDKQTSNGLVLADWLVLLFSGRERNMFISAGREANSIIE